MFATPPNYGISGAYVRPDFTTLPHQQQCYQQLPPQHQQHQQKQQQKQAKRPLCHTKSIAGAAKLISATAHAAAPITAPSTDSISTSTIVSSNTPTPISTTNSVRAVSVPQAKRQLSRTDDPLMSYGLRLGYTRARVADALRSLKSRHGGRGQLKVTADQLLGALLNCETSESDHDNHASIYDTPSPASSIASPSRSSPIDDNNDNTASRLRPIVIDGNNVAIRLAPFAITANLDVLTSFIYQILCFQCTLYIVYCTLYTVQCTMYSVQCTVYTVQCTMYSVHCTAYNVYFKHDFLF